MPVSNKQIAKLFKLGATLLELHDDNSFKSRSYENAAFTVRQIGVALSGLTEPELEKLNGIGKSLAKKIGQISQNGTFDELDNLMELTPPGLIELMNIKGIGGKKIKTLWKEAGISSPEELIAACHDNRVADLKGFGKKTQETYIELVEFYFENRSKYLFSEAEEEMNAILEQLQEHRSVKKLAYTGDIRRRLPVIEKIEFLIALQPGHAMEDVLRECEETISVTDEGYVSAVAQIPVYFSMMQEGDNWYEKLLVTTGNDRHLNLLPQTGKKDFTSEEDIYTAHGLPYIIPEMREGRDELDRAKDLDADAIIRIEHIRGCLHNHSLYSDGAATIEQMARYCHGMGLEYFGLCDHSQTAVYANGLKPNRVKDQWKEIDKLNADLAPFRIFKGIESDILNDGSLDYTEDMLQQFDFVVASVHSNLKMKQDVAEKRLIKAIENPYTTILGHMTARLLLTRAGFPVDHKKIIDACVANRVVIEINADPRRLDMDWEWHSYAMQKGAMFSINPDAHEPGAMMNMYYGVCVARKGGITKDRVLNTLTLNEVDSFFKNYKSRGTI